MRHLCQVNIRKIFTHLLFFFFEVGHTVLSIIEWERIHKCTAGPGIGSPTQPNISAILQVNNRYFGSSSGILGSGSGPDLMSYDI